MFKQYQAIKERYPDCLLFFRLGDFYELFFEDAKIAAKEMEITLTAREGGRGVKVPMCGVPFHAADHYLTKLVARGYKVAICEQMQEASASKGLVQREVVRVVTPGTMLSGPMENMNRNSYLMAVLACHSGWSVAAADISTGDFLMAEFTGPASQTHLAAEIARLQPKEYLLAPEATPAEVDWLKQNCGGVVTRWKPPEGVSAAVAVLQRQFGEDFSSGPGGAILAAAMVLSYMESTQKTFLAHLHPPRLSRLQNYMVLDAATQRNLEIVQSLKDYKVEGSLLGVLDRTVSAMGARTLRQWVQQPLQTISEINRRLDAVGDLTDNLVARSSLQQLLNKTYDVERLLARITFNQATARDLLAIARTLSVVPRIKALIGELNAPLLVELGSSMHNMEDLCLTIEKGINPDPPAGVREGGIIKDGFDVEVDRLRQIQQLGREWIAELETKERETTGIKSLKIGYNRVFGYYFEITRANLGMVPAHFNRKQTLSNCERFTTPELQELEEKILTAAERLSALEYEIFCQIRNQVAAQVQAIQITARAMATLDALCSLAEVAGEKGYTRPLITDTAVIQIREGRHPVVEEFLRGAAFVPNDTALGNGKPHMMIITGPNMAGKSTYMRQVALITLMAHIGSFVPAREATIGLVDRIFTRIGASDYLAGGHSTFMVEMVETAAILHQATKRSLVLMDEVGRGTGTFDGLSIARAVVEYMTTHIGCHTLFSTHYHEMTDMADEIQGIQNMVALVKEDIDGVTFLHKVVPGRSNRSYGINVARLSGLPAPVLQRATAVMAELAAGNAEVAATSQMVNSTDQMTAKKENFRWPEIMAELREINILETTPIEALRLLDRWQKMVSDVREGEPG